METIKRLMGRGGGQVVSVITYFSDDPSSDPGEVYSFYSVKCLKQTNVSEKEAGMAHLKKSVELFSL